MWMKLPLAMRMKLPKEYNGVAGQEVLATFSKFLFLYCVVDYLLKMEVGKVFIVFII